MFLETFMLNCFWLNSFNVEECCLSEVNLFGVMLFLCFGEIEFLSPNEAERNVLICGSFIGYKLQ